jgi:hypothetical protein
MPEQPRRAGFFSCLPLNLQERGKERRKKMKTTIYEADDGFVEFENSKTLMALGQRA